MPNQLAHIERQITDHEGWLFLAQEFADLELARRARCELAKLYRRRAALRGGWASKG